jgi:predicted nucleotidyltransferase
MALDLKYHLDAISKIKLRLAGVPARMINLTISGAHLYGFESEDSDVDYRGMFQVDTNRLLGLSRPKDVIEMKFGNNEVVLFEVQKEIGLALGGNCNVMEHLNAKQIVSTAEFIRLRQLLNNAAGKIGLYNSYKGMAEFNYKKFILSGKNSVKKYLYVFRGLMAGIYVLQTGQIEPNIEVLNDYFKIPEVKELIQLKREGLEWGTVPSSIDNGRLEILINELFERLDGAFEKCKMPDRPTEEEKNKISEFLIGMRKDYTG